MIPKCLLGNLTFSNLEAHHPNALMEDAEGNEHTERNNLKFPSIFFLDSPVVAFGIQKCFPIASPCKLASFLSM